MRTPLFAAPALLLIFWSLSVGTASATIVVEGLKDGSWSTIANGDLTTSLPETQFGSVTYGSSFDRSYRVRNTGTEDVTVSVIEVSDLDYSLPGVPGETTLSPGQSLPFTVRFTAPGGGAHDSEVRVLSNAKEPDEDYRFAVLGFGESPLAVEGRQTFTDPWGAIPDGDSTPSSTQGTLYPTMERNDLINLNDFRLTNSTSTNLVITDIRLTGPGAAAFSLNGIPPNYPVTFPPGEGTEERIRFEPGSAGSFTATVVIKLQDFPDFIFTIEGDTTDTPLITVERQLPVNSAFVPVTDDSSAPERIAIGTVSVPDTSSRVFRIENLGFDTLTVNSIEFTGSTAFSDDAGAPFTLASGGQREFAITFEPSTEGPATALVTVNNDTPGSRNPYQFEVTGWGQDDRAGAEIEVSSIWEEQIRSGDAANFASGRDFGLVAPGDSGSRTFTVSNPGVATLNVTGIISSDPTRFSATPSAFTVPPGGEMELTATYAPGDTGDHGATLSIIHNDTDGDEAPFLLNLEGSGANAVPEVRFETLGGLLIPSEEPPGDPYGTQIPDFDLDGPGTFSQPIQVNLRNTGTVPLSFYAVDSPEPFFTAGAAGSSLAPGATRTITLQAAPTEAGDYVERITLLTSAGGGTPASFQIGIRATRFEPEITNVEISGADFILEFTSSSRQNYTIEQSTNLGTWVPITGHENFAGSSNMMTRTLSGLGVPPAAGARFIRVRTL